MGAGGARRVNGSTGRYITLLMPLLFIIDLSAQPQSSFNKPTRALPAPQHTAKQRDIKLIHTE